MNSKPIKIPGPDHPITITRTQGRVAVIVNVGSPGTELEFAL